MRKLKNIEKLRKLIPTELQSVMENSERHTKPYNNLKSLLEYSDVTDTDIEYSARKLLRALYVDIERTDDLYEV